MSFRSNLVIGTPSAKTILSHKSHKHTRYNPRYLTGKSDLMLRSGAPWWMYVVAGLFIFAFLFNARQEFWGPASGGWIPEPSLFKVAGVLPGGPMDKAGIHAGDVLEAVDGYPLNGAGNWFLARAHFERSRPIDLQVGRGEQHLALKLIIAEPVWQTWNGSQFLAAIALQVVRSVLLLLAIFVGFSRPEQLSSRLAALIFWHWIGRRRVSQRGMGGGASSLACGPCHSYRPDHGLWPIGSRSMANVFCELP